jgi:pimeloyl-ACP methyl ester carboxylesterase
MPYANNQGVRIYYEVEGQGPPLVLGHGFSSSLNRWRELGYVDALRNEFKLVLFDARGHGQSDKPHDPAAYETIKFVQDVVSVLDDTRINRANYFGYSMEAFAGFWLACHYADRFRSFVLLGVSPYRREFEAEIKAIPGTIENLKLLVADPRAYIARMEQQFGRPLPPELRDAQLASDGEALIALLKARLSHPSFTNNDLSLISAPCLLICGELDPSDAGAKESVNHMPNARFVSLPGLDHAASFVRSDLVVPHIKGFLAEVNKNQPTS